MADVVSEVKTNAGTHPLYNSRREKKHIRVITRIAKPDQHENC